jgi:hypothetical protein
MLCPRCHGTHVILVNGSRLPCPDCQGVGEIHCCDGLQEQPDAEQVCGVKRPEAGRDPDASDPPSTT